VYFGAEAVSHSSLARTPNFSKAESRRSTRIEHFVPLMVCGQNHMGKPFAERTVSITVNLHGCRYPSELDNEVGTWLTLQVASFDAEPKPPAIRARVRSIHSSRCTGAVQEVGVELENPANAWGIVTPPQDWQSAADTAASVLPFSAVTAPEPEPVIPAIDGDAAHAEEQQETPLMFEHKLAEVTTFPSASPAAVGAVAPLPAESPEPQRAVIPDGLMQALQEKLQQAAEKAVHTAVAQQVDEAVRKAVAAIDDLQQSRIRQVQELRPPRVEAASAELVSKDDIAAVTASVIATHWKKEMEKYRAHTEELTQKLARQAAGLKREVDRAQEFLGKVNNELGPRAHAELKEAVACALLEFDGAAARTIKRRYDRLFESTQSLVQEALLKLDARSAEAQALVQSSVNSTLAALQGKAESQLNAALAETTDRAVSALSSLDAENRAACEARRQALEAEVAHAAERSTDQLRKGMKAFLYSCLVAAVSAVDEHSKATLESLTKDNGKSFEEIHDSGTGSGNSESPAILPASDTHPCTR
jgi:hypothetical protein